MIRTEDKISILMSTYNSSNTIKNSIDSLLNQTYQNFEILISDDNSTDDTFNILQNYEKNNTSIKLFRNSENLGLTKSLNLLIAKASGRFIARQDSDDKSFKNRLEIQIQTMAEHNLDFCTTRAITIPEQKLRPNLSFYIPKKILIKLKNPFIHGSLFIKKSVLQDIGNYDEDFYYAQDYKLMNDLLKKNLKFKIIKNVLYELNTKNNISELKKTEQKYYAECVKKGIKPKKINENLHK